MAKKILKDITDGPESDVVVNHINSRLKKGLNTNIYVIGLSGTGKSSTSQRIAELVNENREGKTGIYIVDSLLELLKAIRNSKQKDVIIIEEVSVLFPSRRAISIENVSIGKVMDTIRKKLLCIISNAPIWNSIDSHMRAMGHIVIETLRINRKKQVVISKFHRLQTNPGSGKTYKHTMRRKEREVQRMFTRMPSLEKWEAYERNKDRFMDQLYQDLQHRQKMKQNKMDKEMGKNIIGHKDRPTDKQWNAHQLVRIQGLSVKKAAESEGISPQSLSNRLYLYDKKLIPLENSANQVEKPI